MKYLIAVCIISSAIRVNAQIRLEHSYKGTFEFGLVEVDSAEWKFVNFDDSSSITIYNIDHSLDRTIPIPVTPYSHIAIIARRLFDLDTEYEYALFTNRTIKILKANGELLYACDTCYFGTSSYANNSLFEGVSPPAVKATSSGTKLLIHHGSNIEVYSLPGRIPGGQAKLGILNDPSVAQTSGFLPTLAYPNPSSGRVRIEYELPPGVSNGEILLLTEDGKEVRRYKVTNAFSDLLIDATELPPGAYFYKLLTYRGESSAKQISIMR